MLLIYKDTYIYKKDTNNSREQNILICKILNYN